MDKTEDGSSILLAKQAMVVRETTAVFSHFANEGVALLMIVMKMHFNVADPETYNLCQAIEQVAPVLFLRIEKAVLRALVRGVAGCVIGNPRPPVAPASDSAKRCFKGSAHAQ